MTPFAALTLGTFMLRAAAAVCLVVLREPMVRGKLATAWVALMLFASSYCLASLRAVVSSQQKLLVGSTTIEEAVTVAMFPFVQSLLFCIAAISAVASVHLRPTNSPREGAD